MIYVINELFPPTFTDLDHLSADAGGDQRDYFSWITPMHLRIPS